MFTWLSRKKLKHLKLIFKQLSISYQSYKKNSLMTMTVIYIWRNSINIFTFSVSVFPLALPGLSRKARYFTQEKKKPHAIFVSRAHYFQILLFIIHIHAHCTCKTCLEFLIFHVPTRLRPSSFSTSALDGKRCRSSAVADLRRSNSPSLALLRFFLSFSPTQPPISRRSVSKEKRTLS